MLKPWLLWSCCILLPVLSLSTAARQKRKASPEGVGEDIKKKKVNEEENQVEEEGQRIVIEHWLVVLQKHSWFFP